jgi:broad specificity phosphatase PhoE
VVETAAVLGEALGVPLRPDPDLREVRMSAGWLGTEAFEARVGAYLSGAPDPAFEPYAEAAARILRCVRATIAGARGDAVAIVSHGRVLTVLFSALCGERLGLAEWRSIRLPDLAVVDLDRAQVVSGFFAGRDLPRLAGG